MFASPYIFGGDLRGFLVVMAGGSSVAIQELGFSLEAVPTLLFVALLLFLMPMLTAIVFLVYPRVARVAANSFIHLGLFFVLVTLSVFWHFVGVLCAKVA